jgi:raffinose/stachyose/melibiose transport system permease protein
MRDVPTCILGSNEGNLSPGLKDLEQLIASAKTSYGAVPGEGFPEFGQYLRDAIYQTLSGSAVPAAIAHKLERHAEQIRIRRAHPNQVVMNHFWPGVILIVLLGAGMLFIGWKTIAGLGRAASEKQLESVIPMRWGNVLLFIGPALALYTIFLIIPSIRSFTWSVHRWSGLTPMSRMPYVGLLNFKRLIFESDLFWISLRNNLFLMFVIPLFVVPLSMFLSACISRGIWGSNFFRVVFFFPNLVGGVAATLLWLQIYNPQGGLINTALVGVGHAASAIGLTSAGAWLDAFHGYAWLEPKHLYWSIVPMSIWGACGFNMILYLAAMESIPENYYDAARIDGASSWRQFWTITLPLIWEILAISLVFIIIGGMKAFEVIWLLTNQQPSSQSHVVSTLMVQTMLQEFRVGEATAIAVLLFLMIFVGTAATLRGMRRETVEF